jgi:hypothetical protein
MVLFKFWFQHFLFSRMVKSVHDQLVYNYQLFLTISNYTNVLCKIIMHEHPNQSIRRENSLHLFSNSGKQSFVCKGVWLIDLVSYVPLKNISFIWRRHHYRWRAAKCRPMFSARESLSCHICCDTGPRFFRSHSKDHPTQSPLTTHKGVWKIYLTRILTKQRGY